MENRQTCISVDGLRKKYITVKQQDFLVLDGIDFEVSKGEFICIVGGSGCGKSTLLRVLSGLDTEYDGNVLVNRQPVVKTDKSRGFVYQEHRLFPWMTVKENVCFVISEGSVTKKREKVSEVLEMVGLHDFENAYPKELSGGMAQRVNIARALVNEPEILFLDEPFGALDALTRMQLQNELLRIWRRQKSTMLLVTHDIEEAVYLADRIIVLTNRPAKVLDIVPVDLPEERDRNSVPFLQVKRRISQYF